MTIKCIKWTLFGVLSFLTVYLVTVWLWANSAAPDLLEKMHHNSPVAMLDPQHTAALIKIEDPSFYDHRGLDISNGQGLTTVTSSVATLVFLGDHQLGGAKGRLQSVYRGIFNCCRRIDLGRDVMALVLNSKLSKQDQLNIFLTSAYLGSSDGRAVIGFEQAAVAYYGKALFELTEDEFLGIVAMLLAPNHYHPERYPENHTQRLNRVRAVVSGQCEPSGWLDLTYDHCATDV